MAGAWVVVEAVAGRRSGVAAAGPACARPVGRQRRSLDPRFVLRAHSLAELVRLGTMTGQCAFFLEASVVAGLNIATAGAT